MVPLIILAGPTGVGKTDLSLELASRLNAEIISADSMQVYRYMNIGTAKPTIDQQLAVRHHLIDVVDPDQSFSVADYQGLFKQTVADIASRRKLPLLVGGTGLYIRACTQSFIFDPGGPNRDLRDRLRKEAAENGVDNLHQRLAEVDPMAAAKIHPNDLVRMIRALEVYYSTGTPISSLQPKRDPDLQFQTLFIFLDRDRAELYRRIEERVDLMLEQGLVDEVQSLLALGYPATLKPMQSLGYRQICRCLAGEITREVAVCEIKQETRHYAKRQLTWFRKEPVELWFNLTGKKREFLNEILKCIEGRLH